MRPSLSVLVATINGEQKLPLVLPQLREIADELVVGVDDLTDDGSGHIASRFADVVFPIPHDSFFPRGRQDFVGAFELAIQNCHCDWILRVDHDETLSESWKAPGRIEELLADRLVTHYNVLRRWAVPPGDRFISSHPWYADYQIRLFRNLPSIMQGPREVHRDVFVLGESRWLTHEWLVHWDLVWHSRAVRQAKVEDCEKLGPWSGADHYYYEEKRFETKPLGYMPAKPRTCEGAISPASDPLMCHVEAFDVPQTMLAGQTYQLFVGIANCSARDFYPASRGLVHANVLLSYHWLEGDGAVVPPWDHPRMELSWRLRPGDATTMFLPIFVAPPPGSYLLQLDVVEEGVAWASRRGIAVPVYPVEVVPVLN